MGVGEGQNAEMSMPSSVTPTNPAAAFFHQSGSVSNVSGAAGTSVPHFEQKAAPCSIGVPHSLHFLAGPVAGGLGGLNVISSFRIGHGLATWKKRGL